MFTQADFPSANERCSQTSHKKKPALAKSLRLALKLRRQDLNLRPRGYEPRELPGCSTPRRDYTQVRIRVPRVNPHFLEKLLKTISACFLQQDYR